jgi:Bacterial pre-peptidase C-terminal domain
MKHINLPLKALVLVMLVLGSVFGNIPMVFGQGLEEEPNNTCPTAQNFGAVALPFTVNGSLDSTPESPDVDFFKFTGPPGALVKVDLEGESTGKGTLGDPFLGLFDSACNLIAVNDDSFSLNSRLVFAIPADGVFILAATLCCDSDFIGGGIGTYQLTITRFTAIGSITARVVDVLTKDPLPGDTEPFAVARLLRCEDFGCLDVNAQSADSQGRVQFSFDSSGLPLEVGTYQVVAFANQYQEGQTHPFGVAGGENRNIGHVPLQPFPVLFSNTVPCNDLPPQGGRCQYSVTVTNGMTTRLNGEAWSLVQAFGIGSFTDFTNFQVKQLQPLRLQSLESSDVRFEFQVPSKVRDGAFICTNVFVGERPDAFFDTVGTTDLFCILKGPGATGFSVMSQKKAQQMFRQVNGRALTPPKKTQ